MYEMKREQQSGVGGATCDPRERARRPALHSRALERRDRPAPANCSRTGTNRMATISVRFEFYIPQHSQLAI